MSKGNNLKIPIERIRESISVVARALRSTTAKDTSFIRKIFTSPLVSPESTSTVLFPLGSRKNYSENVE
jgi:hypothetical protein